MHAPTADALKRLADHPDDTDAWDALASSQRSSLLSTARQCCSDLHMAEDAVQETLLVARRDAYQFHLRPGRDPESQARAWLSGIVIHRARNQMRAAVRRQQRHRRHHQSAPSSPEPADRVAQDDITGLVHAAIAAIPEQAAQAVTLRYVNQLDYPAIADALNTTEAAARKRVQRGIAALRRRLRRSGYVLGLLALLHHLQAARPANSPRTLPPQMFQTEILTMPGHIVITSTACLTLAAIAVLSLALPLHAVEPEAVPLQPPVVDDQSEHSARSGSDRAQQARPMDDHRPPALPSERQGTPPLEKEPGAVKASLIEGNTEFAIKLFKRVAAGTPDDVTLGPASISTALAMVAAGAAGNTKQEFQAALQWPRVDEPFHRAWKDVLESWHQSPGVELTFANRLYMQHDAPVWPAYKQTLRTMFGAETQACDFKGRPDAEREVINAWISEQTKQMIPELLAPDDIKNTTRAVLTNACYFKGRFVSGFEYTELNTPFHSPDGETTCAMMWQTSSLQHVSDDRVDVVSLAYADQANGPVGAHLMLIVPKSVTGLAVVEQSLQAAQIATWRAGLSRKSVALALPRFEARTRRELNGDLQALGLRDAFTAGKADFSQMVDLAALKEPSWIIDTVVHEARVITNERGSKAAAATAVVMVPGAASVEPTIVAADRPFLWLITDATTGSILFMGRVTAPQDPGPAPAE